MAKELLKNFFKKVVDLENAKWYISKVAENKRRNEP
ncbi:hypothetical protein HNO89_004314 [Sporosarcina luteola]|nr:hypothetical protein [Sporosarcina luteola]